MICCFFIFYFVQNDYLRLTHIIHNRMLCVLCNVSRDTVSPLIIIFSCSRTFSWVALLLLIEVNKVKKEKLIKKCKIFIHIYLLQLQLSGQLSRLRNGWEIISISFIFHLVNAYSFVLIWKFIAYFLIDLVFFFHSINAIDSFVANQIDKIRSSK